MNVQLETAAVRARVIPAIGAGLAALDVRGPDGGWWPLLRPAPEGVTWFNDLACYLLAPWSNRVSRGRYTWRGQEHRLAPDWPDGTAIHGLVKDKPWRIMQRSPVSVALELDAMYRVRYELDDGLRVRLSLRNETGAPMPAGLGFHPFFERKLWDERDEVAVRYAAAGRYPAEGMIPTAPAQPDEITEHLSAGRPLGKMRLDDVFLGPAHGATIEWPASCVRVRYECSANLGHTVLYTERPESFCFEPVSMVNDGFNLCERGWKDTGVVELAPGEGMAAEWAIRVERM